MTDSLADTLEDHSSHDDAYFSSIISWIKEHRPHKEDVHKQKVRLCIELKRKHVPTDIEVFLHASKEDQVIIQPYLQTKPTRALSGVSVIATMAMPSLCPHGACTFCPGGLGSPYGDVPMSYTGTEPSTMRGIRNEFDPYRIIFNRLQQYIILGQFPDKVDQIIMGGTFPAFPLEFQETYVMYSFKAYNDFSREFFEDAVFQVEKFKEFFMLPGNVNDPHRAKIIKERILQIKHANVKSLEEEQTINETAVIRCIGLTIETKPDWAKLEHGLSFLRLGCTRVELGVQTVYDDILQSVNRGHTLRDTKESIAQLKDLGFKLNFHIMPGLPTPSGEIISKERDLESIKTILTETEYQPDMIKIYPCMVMQGTPLEQTYKQGVFTPLSTEEAADIIAESFRYVQPWCRVMRIQRDIPTYSTTAGVSKTNLRQYVDVLLKQRGIVSQDIRAREPRDQKLTSQPSIVVRTYPASNGTEYFISLETEQTLFGFARLRFVGSSIHPLIPTNAALLRELHVYGHTVRIGTKDTQAIQHQGFGKQLMRKAEEICKEHGKSKLLVISGVGVREYYKKIGYNKEGPYMVKYFTGAHDTTL